MSDQQVTLRWHWVCWSLSAITHSSLSPPSCRWNKSTQKKYSVSVDKVKDKRMVYCFQTPVSIWSNLLGIFCISSKSFEFWLIFRMNLLHINELRRRINLKLQSDKISETLTLYRLKKIRFAKKSEKPSKLFAISSVDFDTN